MRPKVYKKDIKIVCIYTKLCICKLAKRSQSEVQHADVRDVSKNENCKYIKYEN